MKLPDGRWLSPPKHTREPVDYKAMDETRSINNPAIPLSDAYEDGYFGATSSRAGVSVNPTTATGLAAFWRAINLIAGDVGRIPIEMFSIDADGGKEPAKHPARFLIKKRPRPLLSSQTFRRRVTQQALLHGRGNAIVFRDRANHRPTEILPIPTRSVDVVADPRRLGGRLYLYQVSETSERVAIPEADMIDIRSFEDDEGLEGVSAVERLKDALGIGIAAERYGSNFYKQGASPGVLLKPSHTVSAADARDLERRFQELVSGVTNAHRAILLPRGVEAEEWNQSNRDSQWIETRKFTLVDVANAFGIPGHKLGTDSHTSYSSLEQEEQSYLDGALDPYLVSWEAELFLKLLTPREQELLRYDFRYNRAALVRADIATRYAAHRVAIESGWKTRNEVRVLEDMSPGPPELDEFIQPMNMGAAGDDEPETKPEPEPEPDADPEIDPEERAAARELLSEAVGRCRRRVARQTKEKRSSSRNRIVLEGMLRPAVRAVAILVGAPEGEVEYTKALVEQLVDGKTAKEILDV